jgi:hypothetical protein
MMFRKIIKNIIKGTIIEKCKIIRKLLDQLRFFRKMVLLKVDFMAH